MSFADYRDYCTLESLGGQTQCAVTVCVSANDLFTTSVDELMGNSDLVIGVSATEIPYRSQECGKITASTIYDFGTVVEVDCVAITCDGCTYDGVHTLYVLWISCSVADSSFTTLVLVNLLKGAAVRVFVTLLRKFPICLRLIRGVVRLLLRVPLLVLFWPLLRSCLLVVLKIVRPIVRVLTWYVRRRPTCCRSLLSWMLRSLVRRRCRPSRLVLRIVFTLSIRLAIKVTLPRCRALTAIRLMWQVLVSLLWGVFTLMLK